MSVIGFAGQRGYWPMRRPTEPVEVARAAKALLRARPWRNPTEVPGYFRLRFPEALAVLELPALQALTRRPPDGGCHWCSVFVLTVTATAAEPPRDAAHLELLGAPCQVCAQRHLVDAARRQARQEATTAALTARPPRRPRAPTGVLWPAGAGQPPAVTAALTAATRPRRRSIAASRAAGKYRVLPGSVPSYYRRRPLPADA